MKFLRKMQELSIKNQRKTFDFPEIKENHLIFLKSLKIKAVYATGGSVKDFGKKHIPMKKYAVC